MGLDAYLYAYIPTLKDEPEVDFEIPEEDIVQTELEYWRKHPNLEKWMSDLYYSKGGLHPTFNCAKVALSEDDLATLEKAVENNTLPIGGGFFHGEDSDEYYKEKTLKVIEIAHVMLEKGFRIYYTSWW